VTVEPRYVNCWTAQLYNTLLINTSMKQQLQHV
jgi:hypothetical protein